jgi:hypothetical protein
VPGNWTKDVGLTDGQALDIHVLVLGEGKGATKLKLMEVPGANVKKSGEQAHHQPAGDSLSHHSGDGYR